MPFCQLGRAKSLREIGGGLACAEGKLSHLGIMAPSRSTLAYANARRPWPLYQTLFFQLLAGCQTLARGRRTFRFLTNHLTFGPTTIARIHKDRWQIALLFKALKQRLKVTTFVRTSANALHIQLWTALIALLALRYLCRRSTFIS
jgi:hypothetical protein